VAATNPQAGPVQPTEALAPWTLGQHEGEPVTPARLNDLADRIRNRPDEPIPGAGRYSNAPGESFNDFKDPLIDHIQQQVANWQPGDKPLNVTHYRDIVALRAWLSAGARPDRAIDTNMMTTKGDEKPGELFVLDPRTMNLSDSKDASEDGIFYLRHGETAANEGAGKQQAVNLLKIARSAPLHQALATFASAGPQDKTAVAGILRRRLANDRGRQNWNDQTKALAAKYFNLRPLTVQPQQDFSSPQPLQ
jgi:broad specificity phosphatase PhoE